MEPNCSYYNCFMSDGSCPNKYYVQCDGCSDLLCAKHTHVQLVSLNDYRAYEGKQVYGNITPFRIYLCEDCRDNKDIKDLFSNVNL